ncbi:MAG TPA: DUF3488 and transglutaminase-like domain-containing protein [Holophagaceae bacterium]|nr:DUF3488 and transglutaminase-like domain-containing protein [Holophagaceae bacterium]
MRFARWLDHLPVWLAYAAVATTGIYEPWELVAMALPLALAAVVEYLRLDLGRWRLALELVAVALVVADFLTRQGFFAVVVHTLCLLSGLRLALPRTASHRRQLLLMGFLLFLTTSISTTDLAFLGWTLAWMAATTAVMLQLSWEHSASLRRGPTLRPPFGRIPAWTLSAILLASGFFVLLPRLTLGWRPMPSLSAALGSAQAGLGDSVDLGDQSPIQPNGEVVMRVVPPDPLPGRIEDLAQDLGYFRAFALESLDGLRWEASLDTPMPPIQEVKDEGFLPHPQDSLRIELFLSPNATRQLPLPYGTSMVATPFRGRLVRGRGASLRLPYLVGQGASVQLLWYPRWSRELWERPPSERRKVELTQLGPDHEAARKASLAWAPPDLAPRQAVAALAQKLRGFHYTLDNPSGAAANPLEDFLERSHAGHCEYFASSLALMLRARGIPARVVNGYRLGPWVPEGHYFLVTQNEAHAWVEYWDRDDRRWHMADAAPVAPPQLATGFAATWQRWADVLRFQWSRHVVRFSDEDQMAGLGKVKALATGWKWQWRRPSGLAAWALVLAAVGWGLFRLRPLLARRGAAGGPVGIRALKPLLARARDGAEPMTGETARAWLLRLARIRPDRAAALAELAEAADRAAYGDGDMSGLRALARREARAWRRLSGPGR